MKKQTEAWIGFAEKDMLTISEIIENEDLLSTVNDIYLESRYPGEIGLLDDGSMPSVEQANQFFIFAKEIEAKIKNELNKDSNVK
jgi:hypothetical protein